MCTGSNGWTLCPYEWNDQGADGGYARMNNLKNQNPSLKTLLAVGGWNHGSTGFVEMASSQANIDQFVVNAMNYVNDIGYDGLDLDWEYPAKTTVDTSPPEDYENFQSVCDALRTRVDSVQPGFFLSAAVGIGEDKIYEIDNAPPSYNIANLMKNMDLVNLMTYDLHGHWEEQTGHHALAHVKQEDDRLGYTDSIEWVLDNWILLGADPKKLTLGLAGYGRSFKLADSSNNGYMAQCELGWNGLYSGAAGPYTREGGYLAYYEVCEKLNAGWTSVWDDEGKVPYAHGDGDWVGYDNPDSIQYKVEMAKDYGLGGIMWWATDIDDFDGSFCNQGKYPLMTRGKNVWLDGDYMSTTSRPTTQSGASTRTTQSSTGGNTGGCSTGEYFPSETDCAKFQLCDNGELLDLECSSGLIWDTTSNACNWPSTVDCCNGQRPCNL